MKHSSSRFRLYHFAALATLGALATAQAHKELGRMWTFEDAPLDYFEKEYGFRPTQEWLDRVRLASLRYANKCSASFISSRGLILTNHHCARDEVKTVSPAGADWLTQGFFADSLKNEIPVPDVTVDQLVTMRDVTEEFREKGREAILAAAKQAEPQLRHEVVALYQGGRYRLYSYKIYDDIRLVAAPQLQLAKFGGDPDNFTYPRFSLDFAMLRAWENGEPADTTAHYLRYKTAGPADGETVFVTGNPGSTGRLSTLAQMEFMRDFEYPGQLDTYTRLLDQFRSIAERDEGTASRLRADILTIENAVKAFRGWVASFHNDAIMAIKRESEQKIRDLIDADPKLKERFGTAWTELEDVVQRKTEAIKNGDRSAMRDLTQREPKLTERIGEAYFAVYGTAIAPDATMSPRIADGVVKGFEYNGTVAPWFTSLYGLFARNTEFGNQPPFHLPENWQAAASKLDLTTPFNLVATCDIIGGNSGSPLIDKEGNLVGLVFDGNIESLGNKFVFTDEVARTVCVHPAIIIAALRDVYGKTALADEVEGKGAGYK